MKRLEIVLAGFLVLVIAGLAQAATVENSNPLPGATDVPLEIDFSVTFSEPMNEASVFDSLLKLENLNTGSELENVSLQNLVDWGYVLAQFNGNVLSITSDTTNLEPNTTYRITIIQPITATDLAGNPLLPYMGETEYLFTTIGDPLAAASVIETTGRVDLVVTDAMGRTITRDVSAIPSASYIEIDLDGDGKPDRDRVVVPGALMGNYTIEIVPELGATGNYTLVVSYGEELITLADDLPIQTGHSYTFFFPQRMMVKGWSLISVPVQLPNYAIEVAFQSMISNCSSVWTYETTDTGGEWKRYVRNRPQFLSNLGTIQAEKGYWVLMADTAVLTLDGDKEAVASIQWEQGWNLVGYNYLKAWSVGQIKPLNCDAVWTYDVGDGGWKRHIEGGSNNDLVWMKPGEGYWMHISGGAPPAAAWSPMVSTDKPAIPYTIWGNVVVDGVEVTGRDTACRAPTVLLKVDGEVQSSYQLGTVARYENFYVLDVPETGKSPLTPLSQRGDQEEVFQRGESFGSAQVELCVQIDDTVMKAAPVPPGRPGQVIRFDLSVQLPPKVSLLHQNYPNPFNPDTWIPYQLREDAHVVIRIYAATGQLVRTLNLGHKPAGFYTDRETAAYWDGKNEAGERVASGIYFYGIKAGDLTATRKMTIIR